MVGGYAPPTVGSDGIPLFLLLALLLALLVCGVEFAEVVSLRRQLAKERARSRH